MQEDERLASHCVILLFSILTCYNTVCIYQAVLNAWQCEQAEAKERTGRVSYPSLFIKGV